MGHALGAVRYAAAVLGWSARLLDAPGDDDVAALLGLDREGDFAVVAAADREHPDGLVVVAPAAEIDAAVARIERGLDELARGTSGAGRGPARRTPSARSTWSGRRSPTWPRPRAKPRTPRPRRRRRPTARRPPGGSPRLERPGDRARRRPPDPPAAQRGGPGRHHRPARRGTFFGLLDRLLPRPAVPPWDALPWAPRVHPVLFVHRVDGLTPGLYLLERSADVHEALRAALRAVVRVGASGRLLPTACRLFRLEAGDTRSFARLASCHQEIAADSAFAVAMLADLGPALDEGPWWYRRLHWEAGLLGQVLYLEAEASGVRGTGIGCFFDDVVHETLGLADGRFRDLYHFTVGGAVDDGRLTTRPGYASDVTRRA